MHIMLYLPLGLELAYYKDENRVATTS